MPPLPPCRCHAVHALYSDYAAIAIFTRAAALILITLIFRWIIFAAIFADAATPCHVIDVALLMPLAAAG